jgi:amino-acid N-acetyltransferase
MEHSDADMRRPADTGCPASAELLADERPSVVVRRATLADVELMHALINDFASQGLMLPKSRNKLYQNLRDFFVAERRDEETGSWTFAGCGALHVLWSDLGEVRSLAVGERFQGSGVGGRILEELLHDAVALKLPRIFALTYQSAFFARVGFVEVEKSTLPQKVWGECMDCPKFPNCDEIAMILDLRDTEAYSPGEEVRTPALERSEGQDGCPAVPRTQNTQRFEWVTETEGEKE